METKGENIKGLSSQNDPADPEDVSLTKEEIRGKISQLFKQYRDCEEGGPGTRYRSWEWCHQVFLDKKKEYARATGNRKKEIIDYLSLHLAFYLASWGMYRGSSYLLQRDYKCHKKTVKTILQRRYDKLWDYQPNKRNLAAVTKLLFGDKKGIYFLIKESYPGYDGENDSPTETLITKILLGTFGCIPAFDRFLKSGIKAFKEKHQGCDLTQSIENKGKNKGKTFRALVDFAIKYEDALKVESAINYPPMKCVDMYFWEVGYELDSEKE